MDDFKKPSEIQVLAATTENELEKHDNNHIDETVTTALECPYKVPPWSQAPPAQSEYKFEILKSGQIIAEVEHLEQKATWTFGRLPANDIQMQHPTISRFHMVLQYRPNQALNDNQAPAGWYVYDLGSTHGTYLNKQRLPPRVFIRMHVGHMLRLGSSTRNHILHGPAEDEEPETQESVTELRKQRKAQEEKAEAEAIKKAELAKTADVSWGMSEDADEETDLQHNPFAATNNEELFLDDPKRTLRGYFEREGLDLEYRCDEMSAGTFVCRVELPIDDEHGRPVVAEVVQKGRKKECVVQCALEACRILDRHGVLRQTHQEPLKRKTKTQDSDSDDDFLDRTGELARKKQRKLNNSNNVTLTYDDLLKQENELMERMKDVEQQITDYQEKQKQLKAAVKAQETSEDIDTFMENLNEEKAPDKILIRKLRLEQQHLRTEKEKTERLIQLAKPTDLPFMQEAPADSSKCKQIKKQLPMVGKRNQFSKFKIIKAIPNKTEIKAELELASDEEEVEDDNEHEKQNKISIDKSDTDASKTKNSEHMNSEDDELNVAVPVKVYGPRIIPKTLLSPQQNQNEAAVNSMNNAVEAVERIDKTDIQNDNAEKDEIVSEQSKKRQRPRQRQRKKQEDCTEELEEHESNEKYAKWLPPENQTGDGFTELNKKYGY